MIPLPGDSGHCRGGINVHKSRSKLWGHGQMGFLVLHKVHRNVLLQESFECLTSGIIAVRGREQTAGEASHADQTQQHHQTVLSGDNKLSLTIEHKVMHFHEENE